jgi:hypothetical protein
MCGPLRGETQADKAADGDPAPRGLEATRKLASWLTADRLQL